ncbi:MAG: DUF3299 domain-containing protein [Alcanivorax sp.]|nr:DUF3299 domain-containing protein [Alcanivorax sp.]
MQHLSLPRLLVSCAALVMFVLSSSLSAEDITLEWDDMIPPGWPPPELFEGVNLDELEDDDPEAIEFFARIEELWDEAPMVESLDGKRVRLPGYAIPLEGDSRSVTSFLLVPYFGACIHVPPPPRNQTVLVNMAEGKSARIRYAFFTVWVTGTMTVETSETDLALTGYTITADKVEPYEPE